jgi:hypothetical protein
MVANNSGGEKSIKYGKCENYINELSVVFSDGEEYTVKPLTYNELEEKVKQNNFEGNLYKKLFDLISTTLTTTTLISHTAIPSPTRSIGTMSRLTLSFPTRRIP